MAARQARPGVRLLRAPCRRGRDHNGPRHPAQGENGLRSPRQPGARLPLVQRTKADQPFLAFLLARRARAASLLRYGEHLSPMLLDLAREIAGPEAAARAARLADPDYPYLD